MAAWLNEEDDWEAAADREKAGTSGGDSVEGMKKRKDAESAVGEDGSRNKKNKMSASEDGQSMQRHME